MPIQYPDYNNCLANLACSVMKYFGVQPFNSTYPPADKLFEKEYKNVIVLLLDGMGTNIMEKHLPPDGFFRSHCKGELSSVFPPTTVAATTAMMSGLFANQSCWLGWVGYFKELDRNIVYFLGKDNDDDSVKFSEDPAHTLYPYENIIGRIKSAGGEAHFVAPFIPPNPNGFKEILQEIKKLCADSNKKYIYAYYDQPDTLLHETGTNDSSVGSMLREFEQGVKELSETLDNSLIMVVADHGHTDITNKTITDYPEICDCLIRMPSIEARSVNFFVKPERVGEFPLIFKKYFGSDFILFSKEEVLKQELFGTGSPNPRFSDMVGDYLAAATGSVALNSYDTDHRSNHAGLTSDEMNVPFIVIETAQEAMNVIQPKA